MLRRPKSQGCHWFTSWASPTQRRDRRKSPNRGTELPIRETGPLGLTQVSCDGEVLLSLRTRCYVALENENETMKPNVIIRNETHDDISAITEVTIAAFKTLEIGNHTEQFIIEALRVAKALAVSLVAGIDGRVVGHIAFSPMTISDGTPNWYGLGPVSVLPEHQGKGIGKALIRTGLARLKDMNAQGCCLVGHPDYYRKFGFRNVSGLVHEGVPPEVFFALSFDGHIPQGTVAFHEGFKADRQQEGAGDTLTSFTKMTWTEQKRLMGWGM